MSSQLKVTSDSRQQEAAVRSPRHRAACGRRGRPKAMPDETQSSQIVSRATRLFIKHGYGATTTRDIAATCKISKQTLYRLFPCKAALFAAVIEAHREQWINLPGDDELPLAEALAQIFRIDISDEADQERVDVIRLVLAEGRNFPELAEILIEESSGICQQQLAGWLQLQMAAGRLKPADSMKTAQILMNMVFGTVVMKHIDHMDWPGREQRRAHIRDCIQIFLHGLGEDPAKKRN